MAAPMREAWEPECHNLQDDWLFDSITQYRKLHMFELQNPTEAIAWIGSESLCVACQQASGKSEILQLAVPDKLLLEEEQEGLSKNRDFSLVSGGFHNNHVTQIEHIPQTRCIVTAEKSDNCVKTWKLGDEKSGIIQSTNIIKNVKSSKQSSRLSIHPSEKHKVTFGNAVNNICEAALDTGEITFTSSDVSCDKSISTLHSIDPHIVAACQSNTGTLWVMDVRQKDEYCQTYPVTVESAGNWTADCTSCASVASTSSMGVTSVADATFLRVSSRGWLEKMDLRNPGSPVVCANIGVSAQDSLDTQYIRVHGAPDNTDVLLLSGYDGNTYIFNYKLFGCEDKQSEPVKPLFIHEGHTACSEDPEGLVTWCSVWHPIVKDLALSAASDGSLHAWSPNYQQTGT